MFYKNIFLQSCNPIIIHDLKGQILEVNEKACEVFNYELSHLKTLNVKDLHPESSLKISKSAFQQIEENRSVNIEIDFKRSNGELFSAQIHSNLVEINGTQIIHGIIQIFPKKRKY